MRNAFCFVWLALLVAVAAIYRPSLGSDFLFDDYPNIVDNPAIHLTQFSLAGLAGSLDGLGAGPLGRPVSVSSFALTHLFFGLDPFAFKAINLGIHLLNGALAGWLVFLLLGVLPSGAASPRTRAWMSLWVAAAWLLHPIQFVALGMAVQRMTLLAAMFTLLALIAHLKAVAAPAAPSRWGWALAGWGLFWPLAFLSKESGLLFPVFAILITWFAGADRGRAVPGARHVMALSAAAIVLTGLLLFWRIGWSWLEAGYAARDFTLGERLLTQGRVLWFYLAQILTPSHAGFALYLDGYAVSRGLFNPPSTSYALLAWLLAVILLVRYWRRFPLPCFGLAWFLVGHGLESSFVPLEIAHEHRNYLPSLGPLLAAGWLAWWLADRFTSERRRLVTTTAALATLGLLAALTGLRSVQMANPLNGAQVEAIRHENSARANYVAAWTLIKAGVGDGGDPMGGNSVRFFFEQAERARPGFKLGHLGLITWACASGRPVERAWLDALAANLLNTPFDHGQRGLPAYLLRPLIAMPTCLSREDVLQLFESGARNVRLRPAISAGFLEAAADYELLVSLDPLGAHAYLSRASALRPDDSRLREKLGGLGAGR